MTEYSSLLLEKAVEQLSGLPGIGRKTALRLCMHLLKADKTESAKLGEAIIQLVTQVRYCKVCYNISDAEICQICADPRRQSDVVCVVEEIRDVMAIENTMQFKGKYHVLGGIISPIEGKGPRDLNIDSLVDRLSVGTIREIIMALPATIEGDTTIYYIYRKVSSMNVLVTTIARGVAVGDELEYTDEVTLGRSILNRIPYDK